MKIVALIILILVLIGAAVGISRAVRHRSATMATNDIQEGMKEESDRAVEMAKADHSVVLDYSVESVERVEGILASLHDRHRKEPFAQAQLSELSVRYGAYIGEVIRRKWGGYWEQDHHVAGPGSFPISSQGNQSFPIGWCFKRIKIGPEDNVWHKFQLLYMKEGAGVVTVHPDGRVEEH